MNRIESQSPRRPRRVAAGIALGVALAAVGSGGSVAVAQSAPAVLIAPDRANLVEGVPRGLAIPAWYPSYFERAGIFRGFTDDGDGVIVDARRYPLAPGFAVSTALEREASRTLLQAGTAVGMTLSWPREHQPVVERLWVLPDGLVNSDGDRHGLIVK